jgi:hypothetical protein
LLFKGEVRYKVEISGAKEIVVFFDMSSSTYNESDYVAFKEDETSTETFGAEKYYGNKTSKENARNFPIVGVSDPLVIPKSSFLLEW